jgi:hypothetical protein
MVKRALMAAAACATAVACMASAAGGGSTLGPPPGGPDLAQMALRVSDFPPGARVARQKYVKPAGFVAAYEREFKELTVKLGSKRLIGLESDVYLARSQGEAEAFVVAFDIGVALLDEDDIARDFGSDGLKATYVKLSRLFKLHVGDASSGVTIRIGTRLGEIRLVLAVLSVNRVAIGFFFAGLPPTKLGAADANRLGALLARHVRDGLIPLNVSAPSVTGTPEVGRTLTAARGTWNNKPTKFAYQWQRCDATGMTCAPISGATAQTYSVSGVDVGSTLSVSVTARNSLGAATAVAPVTGIVPGPPVSMAPPAITGTATVGQTLTATTGTWTGAPTAFAFAWRRCDSSGDGCTDIAGTAGQTYVVSAADVGFTVRVTVTATNASGSATAVSAPTTVVVM